ncbi:MAG: adenylyl-sulfate kinase [Planctomycetes bacterium]|nr:adenylyl-sulfate kinase [Planctomycetota bacterium]
MNDNINDKNTNTLTTRDQMNVVVIGHVDHGKSTVIGRLLADTDSLPEGKLAQVKANCKKNSKPFEYAFLLDALKDEQAQGITIDSARCFFKSQKREYIIIDAPGHIEFLKNMVSGAARAEAALLCIDAKEGVQENSRRHGYLLSMLGVRSVAICVNKMDLVDYDKTVFDNIVTEYAEFLKAINLEPKFYIPASAREGDNIVTNSAAMSWYTGPTVLEAFDSFEKEAPVTDKPFRFPVQDIYKFTADGDDRRIIAGRIETGTIKVGDEVIFLPSEKTSTIASIEGFNLTSQQTAIAGQSTGFTLDTQIYINPGELMCKVADVQPNMSTKIRANILWLGRHPMIKSKRYKIKLAGSRMPVWLRSVNTVLDASDLTTSSYAEQVERHDVAECILETLKPAAFDLATQIQQTGRFVIVDNYEIAGGGLILGSVEDKTDRITEHVNQRQKSWDRSKLTQGLRSGQYDQRSALVLVTGPADSGKSDLAKDLEAYLFNKGRYVYYLGISNTLHGIDADINDASLRDEYLRRLGEVAHLFTDAGLILITTASDLDDYELEMIKTLNSPNECVVVNIGENRFSKTVPDMQIDSIKNSDVAINEICELLKAKKYLIEYYV